MIILCSSSAPKAGATLTYRFSYRVLERRCVKVFGVISRSSFMRYMFTRNRKCSRLWLCQLSCKTMTQIKVDVEQTTWIIEKRKQAYNVYTSVARPGSPQYSLSLTGNT